MAGVFVSVLMQSIFEDPPGAAAGPRSVRGGSWHFPPVMCRSAFHTFDNPEVRRGNIGFRVVLVSPISGRDTDREFSK